LADAKVPKSDLVAWELKEKIEEKKKEQKKKKTNAMDNVAKHPARCVGMPTCDWAMV
jgi:hypothetical protein